MSGDWIKMRTDLLDDPDVAKIATRVKLDRLATIGRLFAFWSWADKHAVDGRVDGATPQFVDDIVITPGFADALVERRWAVFDENGLTIPKYERHNGASAKSRALKNARQSRWRSGASAKPPQPAKTPTRRGAHVGAPVVTRPTTQATTREEKRGNNKHLAVDRAQRPSQAQGPRPFSELLDKSITQKVIEKSPPGPEPDPETEPPAEQPKPRAATPGNGHLDPSWATSSEGIDTAGKTLGMARIAFESDEAFTARINARLALG